jgi:hypothetical protein
MQSSFFVWILEDSKLMDEKTFERIANRQILVNLHHKAKKLRHEVQSEKGRARGDEMVSLKREVLLFKEVSYFFD